MSRRVSMPAADDLFRPTAASLQAVPNLGSTDPAPAPAAPARKGASSGRVRHDEKMTVYITSDELMDIEHTRLVLRREHGIAADRGRVVREAVALVLAEFEAHGEDSALVRRLRAR
ncbi:hypothetical protein [Nocardioides phosphati]|nr:hypothetical protein [Nocardioides phosphati]